MRRLAGVRMKERKLSEAFRTSARAALPGRSVPPLPWLSPHCAARPGPVHPHTHGSQTPPSGPASEFIISPIFQIEKLRFREAKSSFRSSRLVHGRVTLEPRRLEFTPMFLPLPTAWTLRALVCRDAPQWREPEEGGEDGG